MLAGEEAAFERFFDAAYPALYHFALGRLDFKHDAAGEVAQTAMCNAIRKLHTYRGEASLLTWLFTFCRHAIYDHDTRYRIRVQVDLVENDPEIRAALESLHASTTEDLDAAIDRAKLSSLVQRALDHLPSHYADALEWKYIDEVPVQEIGVRLGVGTKAAESLLTRARRAFREAFNTMTRAWPGPDAHEG